MPSSDLHFKKYPLELGIRNESFQKRDQLIGY